MLITNNEDFVRITAFSGEKLIGVLHNAVCHPSNAAVEAARSGE